MDTFALVDKQREKQISDAQDWLTKLKQDRFPLEAAYWAKRADDERWKLYLATPARDQRGPLEAYGQVLQAIRPLGEFSLRASDAIRLISHNDRVAKDVQDFQRRFPELTRQELKGQRLGGKVLDVYIYPLGEVPITLYGLIYRGEPSGATVLSFRPQNANTKLEVETRGIRHEYPAETGFDWLIAAPEGSCLEQDGLHLSWDFRGNRTQSSANEVWSLAHLGLHGFRILRESAHTNSIDA